MNPNNYDIPEAEDLPIEAIAAHLHIQNSYIRMDIFKIMMDFYSKSGSFEIDVNTFLSQCEEVYDWVMDD